jgi:transposase
VFPLLVQGLSNKEIARAAVRALIRSASAKRFFLPRYSPDLNPIEQAFAKRSNTSCARPKRAPTVTSAPPSARR